MAGQTINDRLLAAKHSIAGQGLAKAVCKATTEEMIGPKKKHLDCKTTNRLPFFICLCVCECVRACECGLSFTCGRLISHRDTEEIGIETLYSIFQCCLVCMVVSSAFLPWLRSGFWLSVSRCASTPRKFLSRLPPH